MQRGWSAVMSGIQPSGQVISMDTILILVARSLATTLMRDSFWTYFTGTSWQLLWCCGELVSTTGAV